MLLTLSTFLVLLTASYWPPWPRDRNLPRGCAATPDILVTHHVRASVAEACVIQTDGQTIGLSNFRALHLLKIAVNDASSATKGNESIAPMLQLPATLYSFHLCLRGGFGQSLFTASAKENMQGSDDSLVLIVLGSSILLAASSRRAVHSPSRPHFISRIHLTAASNAKRRAKNGVTP